MAAVCGVAKSGKEQQIIETSRHWSGKDADASARQVIEQQEEKAACILPSSLAA